MNETLQTVSVSLAFETFSGRIKTLDFLSGRVDIANKAKDYFFVRRSRLLELATLASKRDVLGPVMVTFELDGKIIESFAEAAYA